MSRLAILGFLQAGLFASAFPLDRPNRNLLSNGDFEFPGLPGHSKVARAVDGRRHPLVPAGWSVTSGSIKYVRHDHWCAASGRHSVALNDDQQGSITQRLKTDPGANYFIYFNMAGDPGLEDGAIRTMNVTITHSTDVLEMAAFAHDTFSHKPGPQGVHWEEHWMQFVAPGGHVHITFTSTTPGIHGPVVDNVRVYKREALHGFFFSPNTLYNSRTIHTLGAPGISAEECARACLETPGCRGFSLSTPRMSPTPGPCALKAEMTLPTRVPEYNHDSYVLKDAECSFGHASPTGCPQLLPMPGLMPLACVAHHGWKRTSSHPHRGVCKPLQHTQVCSFLGGYFAVGTEAIGSQDRMRKCACQENYVGLAGLSCGDAV